VAVLNRALTWLFDAVMGPLDPMAPLAGLTLLSLATAVAVLVAFKWTADQRALVASKRAMQAALFEMRLFNDDLAALLRAQGEVLRQTLTYLRLSLAPTLWLLVPLAALMLHMEFRFGYTGLTAGEAALIKVRLADSASVRADALLESPDAVKVETPAVLLPSEREIAWRIRPRTAGSYELRPARGFVNQLLYPSETPLPDGSGLIAITIAYPERPFFVAGWDIGWAGVYLALTLVFALALKGAFGVVM